MCITTSNPTKSQPRYTCTYVSLSSFSSITTLLTCLLTNTYSLFSFSSISTLLTYSFNEQLPIFLNLFLFVLINLSRAPLCDSIKASTLLSFFFL